MISILATDLTPEDAGHLRMALGAGFRVAERRDTLQALKPDQLPADTEVLCVHHSSVVEEQYICRLPNLRLIATRSTGFNHIRLRDSLSRVSVCNVPDYASSSVAELAFGLMVCLARKLPEAIQMTRHGGFELQHMMGSELRGKTLGVIGKGRIGGSILNLGKALGMKLLVHSKSFKAGVLKPSGAEGAGLPELLSRADFVVLAALANDETQHLINSDTLAHMRPSAFLINVARGDLVSSEALLRALEEGRLKGAALDVLEAEEFLLRPDSRALLRSKRRPTDSLLGATWKLLRHPSVLVTPHVGYFVEEAMTRLMDETAENIRSFVAGRPRNIVHPVPSE